MANNTDRAAKVFELFCSDNENESAAAYERLCNMHVGLKDVAIHLHGDVWETKFSHRQFTVSDDDGIGGLFLS